MRQLRTCLRPVGRALVEAGSLWVWVPPLGENPPPDEPPDPPTGCPAAARTPAQGPPPAHPERLRPDIPLSPVELALRAQLGDPF